MNVFKRRKHGRDLVGEDVTNRNGHYKVFKTDAHGRYFAKAESEDGCDSVKSETIDTG